MTLHSDIWRLPGPGGFARESARLASGGQHVLVILPRYISSDSSYSDALARAIQDALEGPRRLYPSPTQGSLVASLAFNMTDDFDNPPVTVPDLLSHPDVTGRVFVCNVADLEASHLAEFPNFLQRLDAESRTISQANRATMIFILSHAFLPDDPASVTTTRLWYWDRVARWDVAALLASHSAPNDIVGILGEVRLETIIEISRWNLELAIEIARDWTGDYRDILEILGRSPRSPGSETLIPLPSQKRPPEDEAQIEAWDSGILEAWHGLPSTAVASTLEKGQAVETLFWRAQARVLLPWIEVRRSRVEAIVRDKLGAERMAVAVDQYSTRFPDIEFDAALIELPTLARIINARFGSSEAGLRETTRLLRSARNRLAHFKPLPSDVFLELVQGCAWLDQ